MKKKAPVRRLPAKKTAKKFPFKPKTRTMGGAGGGGKGGASQTNPY